MSWKIRKRVLESPGFSINFFCDNPLRNNFSLSIMFGSALQSRKGYSDPVKRTKLCCYAMRKIIQTLPLKKWCTKNRAPKVK